VTVSISRRRFIASTAAGGAGLALGLAAPAIANTGEPIRFGVLQTLSGTFANNGNSYAWGAEIAAEMINEAGGIDGRPIQLEIRDTKMSSATALAGLREFSSLGIRHVMGEAFTSINLATLPLLTELDLILTAPGAVGMELTHEAFVKNFFRAGPNALMQYSGQARMIAQSYPEVTTWGGIQTDNAGFKGGWDVFTAALRKHYRALHGVEITVNDPILTKVGTTDFRASISQLMAQGEEGLFISSAGVETLNFIRQALPFQLFDTIKVTASNNLGVASDMVNTVMPANFITSCYWDASAYPDLPITADFTRRYLEKSGQSEVDVFSTNAHIAVTGMAAGIRAAGSTETAAVVAAMEGAAFDTLHGPLSYRREDHQLLLDSGYIELGPKAEGPGYDRKRFVLIPYEEVIDPPTPGVAFDISTI